jgi:hypothetical protein
MAVATLRLIANMLIAEKTAGARTAKIIHAQAISILRRHAKRGPGTESLLVEQAFDDQLTYFNCEAACQLLVAFFEIPQRSLALLSQCQRVTCRRYFLRNSYTAQDVCPECKRTPRR